MKILGISAYYHDSAAALLVDGEIVSAAQEERFSRQKHDASFPRNAVRFCLERANLTLGQIDNIVFYDKPLLKFERLLETYLAFSPIGFRSFCKAMPIWLREKLFLKDLLNSELSEFDANTNNIDHRLLFSEHHLSHAASAFFPSPYDEAVILTMDGVGEWATTSMAIGRGNKLEIIKEINFPHSIGLLYSAFTYYIGFKVNSGEYKLMGLAPYGNPRYVQTILDNLIDIKTDGSFHLDMSYFNYCTGLTMTSPKFHKLFGAPPRKAEQALSQRDMDLAASIQFVTENIVLRLVRSAIKQTGMKNVCLAGGVALNCVANGKVLRDGAAKSLWIQPASGDSGGALGAAFVGYHMHSGCYRRVNQNDSMKGAYLGPDFSQPDIESRLDAAGAVYKVLDDNSLIAACVDAMINGEALGWFQGRMEFGPRALGARSILADPRSSTMQKNLNLKVKYRESFRPFAPAILREHVAEWFELDTSSPYMLLVANVSAAHRKNTTEADHSLFGIDKLNISRSDIPAVTHVDFSARIQTVNIETNPYFYKLLSYFNEVTGCPLLVNTSFNVRGEPIVCSPEDAFRCFMGTEIEILAIGNCLLRKEEQNPDLKLNYQSSFELD